MSHHIDSEAASKDGRLDLCDLYVFEGPSLKTTVFILTVNPLAGQVSPTTFHPEAVYEFKVSVSESFQEDLSYRFSFSEPGSDGAQEFELRRTEGATLRPAKEGLLLATGRTNQTVAFTEGGRTWAGLSADPFFGNGVGLGEFKKALFEQNRFDPAAFSNAENVFHGASVSAIVLEVPNETLNAKTIQVWATTTLWHHDQHLQINRAANPLMLHLFINEAELKDAHNQGRPEYDRERSGESITNFVAKVTTLAKSVENPTAYGARVAATLLPDVLTYQPGSYASYGFAGRNGRKLSDHGMNVVLSLLANGPLSAQVVSEGRYSSEFPYLVQPLSS